MFHARKRRGAIVGDMRSKIKRVLKAFDEKDISTLTTLIAHKRLDPNKLIPDKGVTFFHLIIGHQSENFAFKVTKLFLRCGGDPNITSEDGVTPVHVAAAWGRIPILHLLLVNGGDPWLQDDEKKNAFNYAFEEQKWDAIEMLHHFQRMHSSSLQKRVNEQNPKIEFNFERILLTKGDKVFEYALTEDRNERSPKKQLKSETEKDEKSSPVLNKIKYFESHPSNFISLKHEGKSKLEKSKEHYKTSCEFIINMEKNAIEDEKIIVRTNEEEKKHFISSIHIDTSPLKTEELPRNDSLILINKPCNKPVEKCLGDVRSQLFMELQEAVLRRSKFKLSEEKDEKKKKEEKMENIHLSNKENLCEASVIELSESDHPLIIYDSKEKEKTDLAAGDPFVAKEVSYLYGVNLSKNPLLRHMSDFATKVMNEIQLSEGENKAEVGNATVTSTYLTCEEESHTNEDEGNMRISGQNVERSSCFLQKSSDSFESIVEEYKYSDPEEGIMLLEKKLIVTPTSTVSEVMDSEEIEIECDNSSVISDVSSIPSTISYASDTLRNELTNFGFNPGPITKTTKKLYLRKLWRLKKANKRLSAVEKVYSAELEKTLRNETNFRKIMSFVKLEEEMMKSFDNCPNRKWKEGGSKTSFNYLLLDPRICLNLPRRAMEMTDLEIWKCFLSAIFYVGKGKRARPYAHLYEAASSWQKTDQKSKSSEKINCIIDIWSEDLGVVCLHIFQNIIPVEALTREAAMIDAIGLPNLKNMKVSEYYGSAAAWITRNKLKLGVYLLYKAMLIFLNEGERQIRPFDIS